MVFSVDPSGCPVAEEATSGIGSVPENFVRFAGRAERIVPYLFKKPLFESVLMVAPPSYGWVPMMLSALLAVRPGGAVRIFKFASSFDFDFLGRAGFDVVEQHMEGGHPLIPSSDYLRPGVPVDFVKITAPQRGRAPEAGGGEGGGSRDIVRRSPRGPRSITRKRPVRLQAGFDRVGFGQVGSVASARFCLGPMLRAVR
jgi:hypothetical protein